MIQREEPPHRHASAAPRPILRSAVLFIDFFLIIMALYHLKPASRSLILESHGASALPYIWIGSALVLLIAITLYQHIVSRYRRFSIVLGTCAFFVMLLVLFWFALQTPGEIAPIGFYIFVDLFGVVLVEQFWSLTDSIYTTEEGRRWYGLVGTGGLVGGAAGGAAAALVINYTPLQTADLLLVAAGILVVIVALTWFMGRLHMYEEDAEPAPIAHPAKGWRALTHSRYLLLIAAALLLAQLVSPLVEFQFMRTVENVYPEREARTAILSVFFSVLNMVSIGINVVLTPLILNYLGVLAGLLVQPLVLATSSYGFYLHPTFIPAAIMKISDRGLSYSINRAAKELLYIPVAPEIMYKAKAWIDMFGYRIFKVFGSVLIILLTQWTTWAAGYGDLSVVIIVGCIVWGTVLVNLHREYQNLGPVDITPIKPE